MARHTFLTEVSELLKCELQAAPIDKRVFKSEDRGLVVRLHIHVVNHLKRECVTVDVRPLALRCVELLVHEEARAIVRGPS